jgi:RHS repeat-associated protein
LTYIGTGTGDAGDQYTGLDRFGRVVEQKWQSEQPTPTVTDDFTYSYDRDSNRLNRNNQLHTAFNETYGYDNLNQLTSFARGTHTITWSLDAVGNFSSTTTDGGSPVNNSFNKQNEETAAGTANLAFDNNGNTTTDDQGKTLVYDAWNRLVAYKNGSMVLESYSYDALGRRIVQNPGTATDLYYSSAWQVLEERTGGVSTATIQYVWSPVYVDALILRDRSTQNNGTLDERLWVQGDANYNATALVNASGSVAERDVYDPYGKVTFLNASWGTLTGSAYAWIYLFQGTRLDPTSNLFGNRRRVGSSTMGRWEETDPMGVSASDINLYRYLGDNPPNYVDASGLQMGSPYHPHKPGEDPTIPVPNKPVWPLSPYHPWVPERPPCGICTITKVLLIDDPLDVPPSAAGLKPWPEVRPTPQLGDLGPWLDREGSGEYHDTHWVVWEGKNLQDCDISRWADATGQVGEEVSTSGLGYHGPGVHIKPVPFLPVTPFSSSSYITNYDGPLPQEIQRTGNSIVVADSPGFFTHGDDFYPARLDVNFVQIATSRSTNKVRGTIWYDTHIFVEAPGSEAVWAYSLVTGTNLP